MSVLIGVDKAEKKDLTVWCVMGAVTMQDGSSHKIIGHGSTREEAERCFDMMARDFGVEAAAVVTECND